MNELFKKFGVINENETVSITNCVVMLFVAVTCFKMLFSGMSINYKIINWKVEAMDVSTTLPLLFSLMNYGHRRIETNKLINEKEKSE